MNRVYNFSAGPACLPLEVLKEAQEEMLDYRGCGMSVMEMSHRSAMFQNIIDEAEADLRDLMGIPENYKVMFLQGGATAQFAAIPLNLFQNGAADYIVTGTWSKKAFAEAKKFTDAQCIATSEDKKYSYVPDLTDLPIRDNADYVYICQNETIHGTTIWNLPNTKGKELVADVSSCFLSMPIDVSKFGVVYGGVQKNIGPAGMAIVIVREDLLRDELPKTTPIILDWKTFADAGSMYNTPPCYTIYMCGKTFKWLKNLGGLEGIYEINKNKAGLFYDYLDSSKMFKGAVVKEDRSLMNIPFVIGNDELEKQFIAESKAAGFDNLKGHRSVGGMRASIYNAMPTDGVKALIEFMKDFEEKNISKLN
jgi:phosphoserine aminotransferase